MMADILDSKVGESIYDPTAGRLAAVIDHVKRGGENPCTGFGKICGQEKNFTTYSVALMDLVLHGIEDFNIERETQARWREDLQRSAKERICGKNNSN